jgi:DNA polymerase-3 subunit gamma/tau
VQTSDKPVVGFSDLKIKSQFLLQNNPQTVQPIVEQTNATAEASNVPSAEDVPLTSERAQNAVRSFAEEKSKTGNKQLYATLTSSKISLTDTTITIEINNEVQKELLSNIKQDLLDALRNLLSNRQTLLNIVVSEIAGEVKAYKPDDKFKMMAEKNPALLELKRRFDLNPEH